MATAPATINGETTGTPAPVVRTRIHWGRALAGAAKITAVVVVAVCAYWFASGFFSTVLAGNPGLSSAVAGAGDVAGGVLSTAINVAGAGLTAAGDFLGGFFTTLFPSLAGTTVATQATTHAASHAAGTLAAAGAAAVGGVLALKQSAPILTHDAHASMSPSELASYQATKTALKSTELAHHAAEHAHHSQTPEHDAKRRWTDQVPPRSSAAAHSHISPRSTSFTQLLEKEAAAPTLTTTTR